MDNVFKAIVTVRGRVQGVGFRYSTRDVAQSLKLTGYVKNLPDGSVYIVAQGSANAMNILIEWCKTGPPRAMVESVDYTFEPAGDFASFQIR